MIILVMIIMIILVMMIVIVIEMIIIIMMIIIIIIMMMIRIIINFYSNSFPQSISQLATLHSFVLESGLYIMYE